MESLIRQVISYIDIISKQSDFTALLAAGFQLDGYKDTYLYFLIMRQCYNKLKTKTFTTDNIVHTYQNLHTCFFVCFPNYRTQFCRLFQNVAWLTKNVALPF